MADILLPRRVNSGATRRQSARAPSAENVSEVSPAIARDPGLSVPRGAFGGGIGEGLESFGNSVEQTGDRLFKAEKQVRSREEAVDRASRRITLEQDGSKLLRDQLLEQDFSKKDVLENFGQTLAERKAEILSGHTGSEESRQRLQVRLDAIEAKLIDEAAVKSTEIGQERVFSVINKTVSSLAAQVRRDPSTLFSAINDADDDIDDLSPSLSESQQLKARDLTRAKLAESAVEGYLQRGAKEQARLLLQRDEFTGVLGQAKVLAFEKRIDNIEKPARILTPGETTGLGFPDGVIVQKKGDGSFNVVFKPLKDETVRDQKIKELTDRGVEPERAQGIVDGNIRIEIVPGLGVAREVNELDGTVREVPIDQGQAPTVQAPDQKTLFDLARSGAIAGIVPATQEALANTVGQIPGVPVATDVVQARQEVQVAQNELIRALSINPRFPVAEIKRIKEEIKIEPSIFDSTRSLLARMSGIDKALRTRLANEQTASRDTSLPQNLRSDAARSAHDIENFLVRLGIPEGFDASSEIPDGVPDNSTRIGVTRDGKSVWQTPDGKKLVVE